jgi:hypothetical protein
MWPARVHAPDGTLAVKSLYCTVIGGAIAVAAGVYGLVQGLTDPEIGWGIETPSASATERCERVTAPSVAPERQSVLVRSGNTKPTAEVDTTTLKISDGGRK